MSEGRGAGEVGKVYQGFRLDRSETVSEVDGVVKLFTHERSGARLISVENHDNNKVFGVTFRTVPTDSTGVPHILEHCVLAGSAKYPVKDPFVLLLKGSLNTFINAMTGADRTYYPIASTNKKDFVTQSNVYLDAVFRPLLRKEVFMQEGWRYEFDESGKLGINGIVYNEMKGANSEPSRLLYVEIERSLLPDTPYANDSGGEPKHIPDLSYEQFKAFHEANYHPSNSFIFVYGNHDTLEMLGLANEYCDTEPSPKPFVPPSQARFSEPKKHVAKYPLDGNPGEEGDDKAFATVNWLLGEKLSLLDTITLQLLDHVILMNPSSPLKVALIESGLGEGIATWGLDDHLWFSTFSTGLRGVKPENCDKVEELILSTLQRLAKDGLEKEEIESSFNQIEFSLRENNTGRTPQGLAAMQHVVRDWIYEEDPIEALRYEDLLAQLRAKLDTNDRYLEEYMEKYLIHNNHRVTVFLLPDKDLAEAERKAEREKIARTQANLSTEDAEKIRAEQEQVTRYQKAPDSVEAISSVPRLPISEIDKRIEVIPTEIHRPNGYEIHHHDLFTGGIVYLGIGLRLDTVPSRLLGYAPIFGRALRELGTTEEDFIAFNRRIGTQTGGISASASVFNQHSSLSPLDNDSMAGRFFITGKAVVPKFRELLMLMLDALFKVNLENKERFKQICKESKSAFERQLIDNGHSFVRSRIAAKLSLVSWVSETLGGIEQLYFLRSLCDKADSDWAAVEADLKEFQRIVLNRSNLIFNVTAPQESFVEFQPILEEIAETFPVQEETACDWKVGFEEFNEFLSAPSEVHYVGKGMRLPQRFERPGSASVVMKYLNRAYLWDKIRVEGGAYGAGGGFDYRTGLLLYSSYRDKNLAETLEVYDRVADHLGSLSLPEDEIERLIIGTISDVDGHLLPDAKGGVALSRYLAKSTDELRQRHRDEILSTRMKDFHDFGKLVGDFASGGIAAVIGPERNSELMPESYKATLKLSKVL